MGLYYPCDVVDFGLTGRFEMMMGIPEKMASSAVIEIFVLMMC